MAHIFKLDNDADHEICESGTSGTVYIAMPNDVSIEIYFETDSRQNINLLSVGDALQRINGISTDYAYTLQFEHEPMIKAVISQVLRDNPIDDSEPCEYDTASSLGFANSDFLFG